MALPRPLLALLQSLIKLDVNDALLEKLNTKDPFFNNYLLNYFPKQIIEKFKKEISNHQLRHEIIMC